MNKNVLTFVFSSPNSKIQKLDDGTNIFRFIYQDFVEMAGMLLTKKTISALGSDIKDANGSKISNFAKKQMEKMGWVEGQGLGKNSDGSTTHIKVTKKEESSGLGLDKETSEKLSATEHWWHDDFASTLAAFKPKGLKEDKKKDKKKEKKEKRKEEKKKRKLEASSPPSYEELFAATGGARLGMRARAKQTGKLLRTES